MTVEGKLRRILDAGGDHSVTDLCAATGHDHQWIRAILDGLVASGDYARREANPHEYSGPGRAPYLYRRKGPVPVHVLAHGDHRSYLSVEVFEDECGAIIHALEFIADDFPEDLIPLDRSDILELRERFVRAAELAPRDTGGSDGT